MLRLSAYRSFIYLLSLSLYYFDTAKQYLFLNFIFQLYFAYMNTIDFYIFICSEFINSNHCVDLRLSIYMIVSFRNTVLLLLFQSIGLLFFLPCSNGGTPMLNRSAQSRYLCFTINLKRKTYPFSPLSDTGCGFFTDALTG